MGDAPSNFSFLASNSPQLAKLGALAERYFLNDPPGTLVKLRQFAEFTAKDIAARHALLPSSEANFADVLQALKARAILPQQAADYFHHLRKVGNLAAHEDKGSSHDALHGLKIARAIGDWYHRTYHGQPNFKAGPFVPPRPPVDATKALKAELDDLRKAVQASSDAEAKARLAASQAEEERARLAEQVAAEAEQRAFWEQYAAETEKSLRFAEKSLAETQARAENTAPKQLDLLAQLAARMADEVEVDEATTRVLIDERLRETGWEVDSAVLRYALGVRPQPGRNMAIAEWPTASGPADYALFIDGRCVGVVEAKRQFKDVPGRLGQSKRYARDIRLTADEAPEGGPWKRGDDLFRVPFLFVTNGRPYVKQLAQKSGIWFWDARTDMPPRALSEWFSPRDLAEKLEQEIGETIDVVAGRELGVAGLRPYQKDAIHAVEAAVARGQDHILLAMATGTGKTRLAIALMYELLRAKRFRRILFLVDRTALGRQTLDAMSNTDTSGFLKFDEVFGVADLAKKFPEASDRVQVATVQAMIKRVFDDDEAGKPTPGTYDLIIVDEAHRGYTLDAELREEDLGFRNLDDYLSAYRRVLDYFDAIKVALTATPALHTRQIFGAPVFLYGYRQAVIDGWLIDHRPPRRITTALSKTGISFTPGEEVTIIDPKTGQIDLFDLEDQVDFEVGEFNKRVYTQPFNRAVADAIAMECPPSEPGKTLIFAARNDHADILVAELTDALTDLYGPQAHDLVEKITGSVDKPLDHIKVFKNDPRPKYVVTLDLLTTGIDVPAITNLVFVRRVNSRILYDQMIGRATRRCDEIGKEYFRIFDAVDIYANLQEFTDMRPVVVNPGLTFATLLQDLDRAPDEDRAYVRDQIVVKLRQRIKHISDDVRASLEQVLGPLDELPDTLKGKPPAETLALFAQHPQLAAILDKAGTATKGTGVFVSQHEDALLSIEDNFGDAASPADYITSFETFVRGNMNTVPAMIAATQRPRELTRKELKELAVLLDTAGFSEASLRRAYGSVRNADIAAHIIGFIRQAALGDPLVSYATRVENGVNAILKGQKWTPKQMQWLRRIGNVLREQPVGDPEILSDPLFAQAGGFETVDREFDHRLGDVLRDLNTAIWGGGQAA
jgi:type I restriction enzyme, R subunit